MAFILIGQNCFAGDWDKTEKILGSAFIIGQGINYIQTREVQKRENLYEINPYMRSIAGDSEWRLAAWKIGTTAGVIGLAHILPPKWRKITLGGANLGVWFFVGHDIIRIGGFW